MKISMESTDNYIINIPNKYTLVKENNNIIDKFNNSLFGIDIGIKSKGFISIISISLILSILSIVILYFQFRI